MRKYNTRIDYLNNNDTKLPYENVKNIYSAFIHYRLLGDEYTYFNKFRGEDVTKITPTGDFLLVKEKYIDPVTKQPRSEMVVIENYRRPFWITKESYMDHAYLKEYEDVHKLNQYASTQWALYKNVYNRLKPFLPMEHLKDAKELRKMSEYDYKKKVKGSDFTYGLEVDSRTILKYRYNKRFPDYTIPHKVGVLDFETDVDEGYISVGTVITDDKLFTCGLRKWLGSGSEDKLKGILRNMMLKYIPDQDMAEIYTLPSNMHIKIFDTELEMCTWLIAMSNAEDIDILTGWNFSYDIDQIVRVAEESGVDMADIFHDKSIDEKYKFFEYKKDGAKKISASGKVKGGRPEESWHKIHASSRFQILDYMSAHRFIRAGGATIPGGYSLSNLLAVEGVADKLKFKVETDGPPVDGTAWHRYMSKHEKMKYIIYNIWDCGGVLKMANKTKDLNTKLPILAGVSHLDVFPSGPRKLVDSMFFFLYEHKYIQGTAKPGMNWDDFRGLGLQNWTLTLEQAFHIDEPNKLVSWSGEKEKREP